jgi:hypothetical protein
VRFQTEDILSRGVPQEELPSNLVPTDLRENLLYRRELARWASGDRDRQQLLVSACARDVLFFSNCFVWALDVKRHPDQPDRPFIVWPFQVPVMRDLEDAIGKRSVAIVKSRDLGGSTMPLIVFDKLLLFSKFVTLMVASRNEKLVDDPSNPDSLFYKLDYMNKHLPGWMTAPLFRMKLTYKNTSTGSSLLGSSTTADAGRGGRKHGVFIDEHAAWDRKESIDLIGALQHNTKCRIWVSTPKGVGNGFHQIIAAKVTRTHELDWADHPVHGAGLYRSVSGKLDILDGPYWRHTTPNDILKLYPELEKTLEPSDGLAVTTYPFILDGKKRSPYYDYECLMCPIPRLIAQELDRDFIGSGSKFFDIDMIRDYVRVVCKPPLITGEITYDVDHESQKWEKSKDGRLELWFNPDHHGRAPTEQRFIIGCDISAGGGASNSHLSIGNAYLRAKVGGFTSAHLAPYRFAEYVAAVGRWLGGALIVFEGSGPGRDFGARLKELNYPNLYYMTKVGGKKAEVPGFFPNDEIKRGLLTSYSAALTDRNFTNYDQVAVSECEMFEWTDTQRVIHVGSIIAADPSGAKKNHGDRVSADSILWMVLRTMQKTASPEIVKRNTLAYLQKELEAEEAREGFWSPRDKPRPWSLVRR